MAKILEIPLSARNQIVTVVLLNVTYQLTLQWRKAAQTWFLDIADAAGTPLIQGLALVQGVNLLHQHQALGIGGGLLVTCDTGVDAPTFENLGTTSHLLFVVAP